MTNSISSYRNRRLESSTDSSSCSSDNQEEVQQKARGKLIPPTRASEKWSLHLQELYSGLVNKFHPHAALTAMMDLLHVLKLDSKAFNILVKMNPDPLQALLAEMRQGNITFSESVLSGPSDFCIKFFEKLVFCDIHAARRFAGFCDHSLQSEICRTNAYDKMQYALDNEQLEAKELLIRNARRVIADGTGANPLFLEGLIRSCGHESFLKAAREEIFSLLANNDAMRTLCSWYPSLRTAFNEFRKEMEKSLVSDIASCHSAMPDIFEEACLRAAAGLRDKRMDLHSLIPGLCPGAATTKQQAEFAAKLVSYLIHDAQRKNVPFDFMDLLRGILHSGMPPSSMVVVANGTTQRITDGQFKLLVDAENAMIHDTGMEVAQFDGLRELAGALHRGIAEHPSLKGPPWSDFLRTLQQVKDMAAERVRAAKPTLREMDLALAGMAANPSLLVKLTYANEISRKLQEKTWSARDVAHQLVDAGTDVAIEFLGVLTAQLIANRAEELRNDLLASTFETEITDARQRIMATGLISGGYETHYRINSDLLAATIALCQALLDLKNSPAATRAQGLRDHCYYRLREFILPYQKTGSIAEELQAISLLMPQLELTIHELGRQLAQSLKNRDKSACVSTIQKMTSQEIRTLRFSTLAGHGESISANDIIFLESVLSDRDLGLIWNLRGLDFSNAILGTLTPLLNMLLNHKGANIEFLNFSYVQIATNGQKGNAIYSLQPEHIEKIAGITNGNQKLRYLNLDYQISLTVPLMSDKRLPVVILANAILNSLVIELSLNNCNLNAWHRDLFKRTQQLRGKGEDGLKTVHLNGNLA